MVTTTNPIAELEAKRRAAQRALDQLETPQRALEAARGELTALDAQIAQEQAAAAAARAAEERRAFELSQAQARLDRLLACEAFEVVRLRIDDWRIMVERARQRIGDLGGTPPEIRADALIPPIADRVLV